LVYSREDDMSAGIYRPSSKYKIRAAIKEGNLTGYHLTEVSINSGMWDSLAQYFPAGAVENLLIESNALPSNITTGAWRAPITNFMAVAEQSFLSEVAQIIGVDPLDFRIRLYERAKNERVGGEIGYEPEKLIGVTKLVAEKANWGNPEPGVSQGLSVYYSHNTYVAEIAEVVMENEKPRVKKVTVAVDCGIVINPLAASNQIEGGVVDGIGHAMYGDFAFENGRPIQTNFDRYRMIRIGEAPEVETHFVESYNDPTGLGEPTLPPAGGAVANALFNATGERIYKIPFVSQSELLG
ncbi:MAG: xanthine dehydrogenase family protein molybdopterin-binding subunit, partial [Saprospiraceae bacterium]|nr:xanthine dehydrogenase family protein molybdopterin-binding subunit [Saprospiraceae bacterium]